MLSIKLGTCSRPTPLHTLMIFPPFPWICHLFIPANFSLTFVFQLLEAHCFQASSVLFSVYLVLRCAIRLDGEAYSVQITSQSIAANINDVFLVQWVFAGRSEACDRINNKHWNKSSVLLHSTEIASSVLSKRWRQPFGLSSAMSITSSGWIIVAVRREDYLEVKNVLALLSLFQLLFFEKGCCCCVLFQLMRKDWNSFFSSLFDCLTP